MTSFTQERFFQKSLSKTQKIISEHIHIEKLLSKAIRK